jgi:hypothetical protein
VTGTHPAADPGAAGDSHGAVPLRVLDAAAWRPLEAAHRARADEIVAPHLERRGRGERHPVHDFLFTYYSLRPAQLRRWHAGAGTALLDAGERLGLRDHVATAGGAVTLDVAAFAARRAATVEHVRAVLTATAARPAHLGCFGLHEWAMVYRTPDVRHESFPLRLGPAGTDAVVDGHRIRCSHHDAFRFFTDAARPLNSLQPRREDQAALEQPGCLHATMDLYKWAYKLGPAVPGDLLLACFDLARDTRSLDMRAAPYDLSSLGVVPVRIETAEGKAQYVAEQRTLAQRGQALRERLLAVVSALPQVPGSSSPSEAPRVSRRPTNSTAAPTNPPTIRPATVEDSQLLPPRTSAPASAAT